jgi:hypothetical protein
MSSCSKPLLLHSGLQSHQQSRLLSRQQRHRCKKPNLPSLPPLQLQVLPLVLVRMLAPQILRLQHRSFPLVLLPLPLPQRMVPLVLSPLLMDQMQLLRLLLMMRQRLPLATAHPHSRQHQQPALRL